MERLTIPDEKTEGGWKRAVIDPGEVKKYAMTLYWMMKKYEDTGLTPEQINALRERDTAKEPEEIPFFEWLQGFIKRYCGGTVEECREAVEKQKPKKPVLRNDNGKLRKSCPTCGCFFSPLSRSCPKCEQAILWENEDD
mgnify:FL=1